MASRIESLTEEQRAQFPVWVKKWTDIGLSTDPIDIPRFERGARVAYAKAGIAWPDKPIIVCSSPLVLALAATLAESFLKDRRHNTVRNAVNGAVNDVVRGAVDNAVNDAVRNAVRGAVHGAVSIAVGGAVDNAVRGADVKLGWHPWLGCQFWVDGWWGSPAYVSFFTHVCELELSTDMLECARAYSDMCESAAYCCLNSDFVMVSDRPCAIHLDTDGRLHNLDGLAVEWRDGWGLYMIHGHSTLTSM